MHTLAVRFAPWQPRWMVGVAYSAQEIVFLYMAQNFWAEEAAHWKAAAVFSIGFGALALLVLMHLAFFRYNPARRAKLYVAGCALAAFVCFFGFGAVSWVIDSQATYQFMFWWINWLRVGERPLRGVGPVCLVWVAAGPPLHRAVGGGRGLQLVQALAPLHPLTVRAQAVLLAFIYAEQLRLTRRALRQRRRGGWLIGTDCAVGLLGVFGWLLGRNLLAITTASFLPMRTSCPT